MAIFYFNFKKCENAYLEIASIGCGEYVDEGGYINVVIAGTNI